MYSYGKEKFSKEKHFKALVHCKAVWICYGICSGSVGFCNDGYACSNNMCQPIGIIERIRPHFGSSLASPVNVEPKEVRYPHETRSVY